MTQATNESLERRQPHDLLDLACRPEAWAGEIRVNLIRILAIALFYGRHLIEFAMAAHDAPVRGVYHLRVTIAAMTWASAAIIAHILLTRRIYPPAMKYITALADVMMITIICAIAGRPQTPLLMLYFLAIATAPLRLSLKMVYATTAAAMAGYLFLLGYYAWYVIGFHEYYATPELRIPRGEEAMVMLALLTAGLLAGQSVRQTRRITLFSTAPTTLPAEGK